MKHGPIGLSETPKHSIRARTRVINSSKSQVLVCAAIPVSFRAATCKHGFLPAGVREMGFNSSPGAVQGLQCAPSAFLQTLAALQDEHDAEAKPGLSPSSSAAGLGMSNVVMFHLVMPQKAPAVGEESETETMAKNSAFRGRWCFCTAEGKGCIPWFWDNPRPFHGAGECSASIWRTS